MKKQWIEDCHDLATAVLEAYEMSCEWCKYSDFRDICDEHGVDPCKRLHQHCINLAQVKWEAVKMGVKEEIASQ